MEIRKDHAPWHEAAHAVTDWCCGQPCEVITVSADMSSGQTITPRPEDWVDHYDLGTAVGAFAGEVSAYVDDNLEEALGDWQSTAEYFREFSLADAYFFETSLWKWANWICGNPALWPPLRESVAADLRQWRHNAVVGSSWPLPEPAVHAPEDVEQDEEPSESELRDTKRRDYVEDEIWSWIWRLLRRPLPEAVMRDVYHRLMETGQVDGTEFASICRSRGLRLGSYLGRLRQLHDKLVKL